MGLDFRVEAHNMRCFKANFAGDRFVKVPDVHHADEDVLVTSLVGELSLGQLMRDGAEQLDGVLRLGLWDVLGRMVAKMVFSDNFMHQDLHPGNIRLTIRSDGGSMSPSVPQWISSASLP